MNAGLLPIVIFPKMKYWVSVRIRLTSVALFPKTTAREMAYGAKANSSAQISVAITGIAGPTGGNKFNPVGTVCFAWLLKENSAISETCHFDGNRESVRQQSVIKALQGLINLLDEDNNEP